MINYIRPSLRYFDHVVEELEVHNRPRAMNDLEWLECMYAGVRTTSLQSDSVRRCLGASLQLSV